MPLDTQRTFSCDHGDPARFGGRPQQVGRWSAFPAWLNGASGLWFPKRARSAPLGRGYSGATSGWSFLLGSKRHCYSKPRCYYYIYIRSSQSPSTHPLFGTATHQRGRTRPPTTPLIPAPHGRIKKVVTRARGRLGAARGQAMTIMALPPTLKGDRHPVAGKQT